MHIPFRHQKQVAVTDKDHVVIDYDDGSKEYVAYFAENIICNVVKSANFRTKADLDVYLQTFCNQKTLHYGRVRFNLRLGRRTVCSKEYNLSSWDPIHAHMDFVETCLTEHPKPMGNPKRQIETSYVL